MFWEDLYNFLFFEATTPKLFGSFHIISAIILILLTVLAVYKLKDASEATFRKFLLAVWIILVVGEIYRQICFALSLSDGIFVWDYAWYQFPFQLCSSPLYALPFVIFLKEGKLRDGFLCFLSLWSFFGGAAVMIYASDIFIEVVGINIQSIVHHGLQAMVGVLIAVRNGRRMDKQYFLRGLYVYIAFLAVAMTLNLAGYNILRATGHDDTFNMFFISPYFECTLPVLSAIHKATSWWVLLPTYIFGFTAIALLIFFLQRRPVIKFRKETTVQNEDSCKDT